MNIWGIATIIAFAVAPNALAQIDAGTTIVVAIAKDHIVVAADSRSTHAKDVYDDKGCKIGTFNNETVFAAAGLVEDYSAILPDGLSIDARPAARRAFKNAPAAIRNFREMCAAIKKTPCPFPENGSVVQIMAETWFNDIGSMFMNSADFEMDNWLRVLGIKDDRVSIVGIFAGFDSGVPQVITETYGCRKPRPGEKDGTKNCIPFSDWNRAFQAGDSVLFVPFGITDTAYEFLSPTTERAKSERAVWDKWRKDDPASADARIAARLIELTTQFSGDKNLVGLPVSEVVIDKTKGIRWLKNDNKCPESDD